MHVVDAIGDLLGALTWDGPFLASLAAAVVLGACWLLRTEPGAR